ncbi:hypothetical protein Tsubulata_025773 [Turnera subulata]|uniref:Uncharacterized protein n=1 Tax=Turnera subulata TaxID=218843 RepID=A0A9Q0JP14_9ROSI|nr:hypothetical protein Tsubulata_025773 [Turnera subulata]
MNQNKIHSRGNVPFSWENKPGVSKVVDHHDQLLDDHQEKLIMKLPPPPCPVESPRVSAYDIQIPLPPCTFQSTPTRSSSRKGLKYKQDDPFMAAFKECTKSTTTTTTAKRSDKWSKSVLGLSKKGMFINFSCKQSCSVRIDNFVKVSQLPCERS